MRDDQPIGVDDRALDDLALEALAEAHARQPPDSLGGRLLAAAAVEARTRRTRRALLRWRIAAVAAAAVAVTLGGLLVQANRVVDQRTAQLGALARDNVALSQKVDAQARNLASLHDAVDSQAGVLRVLAGPKPLVATLEAKLTVPARGRVVVDPTSGDAAVLLSGLDAAMNGKVYELWAIRGAQPPEPAGLLTVAQDGTVLSRVGRVSQPADVTAFAVSIEPFGGSKAPTGPVVLAGPVAG
jgi:anti-sigma-K factor RskA